MATIGLMATSALMLTAAFPPTNEQSITWLAMIPWSLAFLRTSRWRELMVAAFVAGLLFNGANCDFLCWENGQFVPSRWLLISTLFAGEWLVAAAATRVLRSEGWTLTLCVPFGWVAVECPLGEYVFGQCLGFPPHSLALGLPDTSPILQVADLAGASGCSFVILSASGALADAVGLVLSRDRRRTAWGSIIVAILIVAFSYSYGVVRLRSVLDVPTRTFVLSPNLIKEGGTGWLQNRMETNDSLNGVWVWPEYGIDGVSEPLRRGEHLKPTPRSSTIEFNELRELFDSLHQPFVIGMLRCDPDHSKRIEYNSAVAVSRDGQLLGFVDKVHLIAWAEYTPGGWVAPWEQRSPRGRSDLAQGDGRRVISLSSGDGPMQLAVSLCSEITLSFVHRNAVRQTTQDRAPTFLVNIAYESALRTPVGPQITRRHATLRAIECRRPMVRCVLQGISELQDGFGRSIVMLDDATGLQEDRLASGSLSASHERTLFVHAGAWLSWLCLGVVAIVGSSSIFVRSRTVHSSSVSVSIQKLEGTSLDQLRDRENFET